MTWPLTRWRRELALSNSVYVSTLVTIVWQRHFRTSSSRCNLRIRLRRRSRPSKTKMSFTFNSSKHFTRYHSSHHAVTSCCTDTGDFRIRQRYTLTQLIMTYNIQLTSTSYVCPARNGFWPLGVHKYGVISQSHKNPFLWTYNIQIHQFMDVFLVCIRGFNTD